MEPMRVSLRFLTCYCCWNHCGFCLTASFSVSFGVSEATWAQTRWSIWWTRASARGRGPSISKPGPFYAACATCQVMNCSCSCPVPKQTCERRFTTVQSTSHFWDHHRSDTEPERLLILLRLSHASQHLLTLTVFLVGLLQDSIH